MLEELQELHERRLVHAVDGRHLRDEEVDDRSARRDGAELLARDDDALLGLVGVDELLADLERRLLRIGKHVDQRGIVEEIAGGLGQAAQQVVLELLDLLLVVIHLGEQRLPLLLQLCLLLRDHSPQQLVFEALHRHSEVDHRHTCR